MMSQKTFTNILEANQQLGVLEGKLESEREARVAVTSDLEAAEAAHLKEVQELKDTHAEELSTLKGEHSKEVVSLTDQLEAAQKDLKDAQEKSGKLEDEAKTADEKAADIVGQIGGEPVKTEADDNAGVTSKTPEEIQALYAQQKKIVGSKAKHDFWEKEIKPFEPAR